MFSKLILFGLALSICACTRLETVGKVPDFRPDDTGREQVAMRTSTSPPVTSAARTPSLWSSSKRSLLGDRRADQQGDILTVVIEIDDRAEISNSTSRSRSGNESLAVPEFFGIPQRIDRELPDGATLGNAVSATSSSGASGDGSVSRNERLTLRIAATIVDVLPNGILRIQGNQEVRVNFELRELLIAGYVRPEDVSRQNEITYDKVASARISYGGRGLISDVQQPRYGQQIADIILPF